LAAVERYFAERSQSPAAATSEPKSDTSEPSNA